jgi:hypothetical protein
MADNFPEKRKMVLTQYDLDALTERLQCVKCSFNHDEADTLRNLAKNINTATKLSTKIIITGLVMGFLGGVWFAVKHVFIDFMLTGKLTR